MFRSILGFAVFAVVAFLALKLVLGLFGIVFGLAMTLLVWAAFGFLIYLAIRLVSPSTAAKIRDLIRGRPADA
jgi:threonine/homoserine/homoserine lactone efflux protein